MTDPTLPNLGRAPDERWAWENHIRLCERGVIVFVGAEKWKQGPIQRGELVRCPGCDVTPPHYHEVSDEPKGGEAL